MSTVFRVLSAVAALVAVITVFRAPLGGLATTGGIRLPLFDSPAPGFMLRVDSNPVGGLVAVDRSIRGEAPLLANVMCNEGEIVTIEVAWPPASDVWRRQVPCRPGKSLQVRAGRGR